jgi:hypothetical protein
MRIRSFDPNAEETLFFPRLVGGETVLMNPLSRFLSRPPDASRSRAVRKFYRVVRAKDTAEARGCVSCGAGCRQSSARNLKREAFSTLFRAERVFGTGRRHARPKNSFRE